MSLWAVRAGIGVELLGHMLLEPNDWQLRLSGVDFLKPLGAWLRGAKHPFHLDLEDGRFPGGVLPVPDSLQPPTVVVAPKTDGCIAEDET